MRRYFPGPLIGLLIIIASSTLFWGCTTLLVVSTIHYTAEGKAYRQVCEQLVASGWRDITPEECVRLFREAQE